MKFSITSRWIDCSFREELVLPKTTEFGCLSMMNLREKVMSMLPVYSSSGVWHVIETVNNEEKPCIRWGHTLNIVGNQLIVFGGTMIDFIL